MKAVLALQPKTSNVCRIWGGKSAVTSSVPPRGVRQDQPPSQKMQLAFDGVSAPMTAAEIKWAENPPSLHGVCVIPNSIGDFGPFIDVTVAQGLRAEQRVLFAQSIRYPERE